MQFFRDNYETIQGICISFTVLALIKDLPRAKQRPWAFVRWISRISLAVCSTCLILDTFVWLFYAVR